jgi:hypothetical protein
MRNNEIRIDTHPIFLMIWNSPDGVVKSQCSYKSRKNEEKIAGSECSTASGIIKRICKISMLAVRSQPSVVKTT